MLSKLERLLVEQQPATCYLQAKIDRRQRNNPLHLSTKRSYSSTRLDAVDDQSTCTSTPRQDWFTRACSDRFPSYSLASRSLALGSLNLWLPLVSRSGPSTDLLRSVYQPGCHSACALTLGIVFVQPRRKLKPGEKLFECLTCYHYTTAPFSRSCQDSNLDRFFA